MYQLFLAPLNNKIIVVLTTARINTSITGRFVLPTSPPALPFFTAASAAAISGDARIYVLQT